jgi:hypothetical protein
MRALIRSTLSSLDAELIIGTHRFRYKPSAMDNAAAQPETAGQVALR